MRTDFYEWSRVYDGDNNWNFADIEKSASVIVVVFMGLWLMWLLYVFSRFRLCIARIIVFRNKKLKKLLLSTWNEKLPLLQSYLVTLLKKLSKNTVPASRKTDTMYRYSTTYSDYSSSFISSNTSMNLPSFKAIVLSIIWFILVIIILSTGLPWFTVSPGEVGLIVRLGKLQDLVYTEWLNFKIPLIDRVVKINTQTQKVQATADSASKDLQNITTTIAVNGNIKSSAVMDIYRNIGDADLIGDKIIAPAIQESVKAATAKYTAEELITKRTLVSQDIKTSLVDKLSKYGINVSDVNIVNFQFSQWFDQAIESKVKAEQEALAEKNKLESVKFQAQQSIERAKAEAESIRIQAEAIKSQGGAEYVNLKWIEKWDGKLPSTSLGNSNGLIYNLNK